MRALKKLFNKPPIQLEDEAYGYDLHRYKVRFSLVGPVQAGKSSLAAAIVVAAATMSSQLKDFYCRVLSKTSTIIKDSNNLRAGRFPPKTDPYGPIAPEAGLIIGQTGFRKDKVMQVPICDVGGEIYDVLGVRRPTINQYERIKNINRNVVNHIRDSQGFIITVPAPDAIMFRTDYRSSDADSYLYNVMSQVMDHKQYTKNKIEGVGVWITKWDEAMEDAKSLSSPMDIYADDQGRSVERFLVNGFPNLSMLLKPLRDSGKVRYFRSYFSLARRDDGTIDKWDDGEPKIAIEEDPTNKILKKPVFAEQECVSFIKWAASFGK